MENNIIGIHTPKTAGSSFKEQISSLFKCNEVCFDYDSDPADPASIINIDPDTYIKNKPNDIERYKVIYGHFPSWKYNYIKDAFRITFLRHPIDSVFSIYNYWMSNDIKMWTSPVFKYTKENNLTVFQFARLPMIRYLYSKVYFRECDLDDFDFVGKYEDYASEIDRLRDMTGVEFQDNICINKTSEMALSKGHVILKPDDISGFELSGIEDLLSDDISLYERYAGR